MHSDVPLISGTLKYSAYELAEIAHPVKLSSGFNNNNNKKRYMRHTNIKRDIGACIHLTQFNVVFHSLSKLSFHGNIQFIHVHNFVERDMKRYINSLSL